MTNFILSDLSL